MEAWPEWGSTPQSWAPAANILRLGLCLLLLSCQQRVLAQHQCPEEEYPVGTECCPKCNKGYHVKQVCSELTGTVCMACPPGTFTAHPNGLSQCLPCRQCEPDMGLVTEQTCLSTQDTVCRCSQGHFCQDGDHAPCVACLSHSTCHPGQSVLQRGTDKQDTVCADCQPGTFSPNGTLEQCLPWTKCSTWMEKEAVPGTNRTDVTCSFTGSKGFVLLLTILILALLALVVLSIYILKKRLRTSGSRDVI
ncbi:tumor necrosis factor receptor superfamily member 14 [Dipodomys spectabilis]|uniref:tumor necrosis factor receptor superfamily member 14 n=1 Tax=Dipodomys spectabilis TaxID=105255 RepID=UPI001C535BB0|nr:tumor necrosis factor receptor superfamily member 14 [Dipodomys spectabilis]